MNNFLTLLLIIITTCSYAQEKTIGEVLKKYNKKTIPYIYTKDIILNDSTILLDAREEEEYNVSKIPGAYYVGFNNFTIDNLPSNNVLKNKKIIVYCSIGVRSEKIAAKVKKAGYNNVYNLWGGIFEWCNADKPLHNINNKPTKNIHTYSKKWGQYVKKGNKVYSNTED
jgi:rhodanese-related sulfurtransferase